MNDIKIMPAENSTEAPFSILVVDDDGDERQLCIDVLTGCGYGVEAVSDGWAGWEAIQTKSYNLVITDNSMPRMTGIEMIGKIRVAHPTLPVIMVTTYPPVHEFTCSPELTPNATLKKPCSNEHLLAAVKKILQPDASNHGAEVKPFQNYL